MSVDMAAMRVLPKALLDAFTNKISQKSHLAGKIMPAKVSKQVKIPQGVVEIIPIIEEEIPAVTWKRVTQSTRKILVQINRTRILSKL